MSETVKKNIGSTDISEKGRLATAVSLFSGCGGMDLGAKSAGVDVIYANDISNVATATLRLHLDGCEVVDGDVSSISSFPKADILLGGYPCQPFSMGGRRVPTSDKRSRLYLEFLRALHDIKPLYFVAENVGGLVSLEGGRHIAEQISAFSSAASGYRVQWRILDAKNYGVPQSRKRLIIVGVRQDLDCEFSFPMATHGKGDGLSPFVSHGESISDLPLWPEGEFYQREGEGNFPWYYMSRNRKAHWLSPSYTVVANWRHVTLHPSSPVMKMTWSNLSDGWKQRWDFSDEYDIVNGVKLNAALEMPRRLSWRECARIQTFPDNFEPVGSVQQKYLQIGNAVPPLLSEVLFRHLLSGQGLVPVESNTTKKISEFI